MITGQTFVVFTSFVLPFPPTSISIILIQTNPEASEILCPDNYFSAENFATAWREKKELHELSNYPLFRSSTPLPSLCVQGIPGNVGNLLASWREDHRFSSALPLKCIHSFSFFTALSLSSKYFTPSSFMNECDGLLCHCGSLCKYGKGLFSR